MTVGLLMQWKGSCAFSKQRRGGCSELVALSLHTPRSQPGSLPWCGWREEEEGRKEGEQELPAVGLSLAMNSCLGAGHGAQGQSRGSNHPARAAEDGAGCDPELHKEGMLRKGISVFFLGLCFHVII